MTEPARREAIQAARTGAARAVEAYVRDRLFPALGRATTPFRVDVPGEGLRSLVFFVIPKSGPSLVVRCVPSRDDASWLAAAVDLFQQHRLPSAHAIYRDLSLWTRWRRGWRVFVEELVDGTALGGETDPAALASVGETYARVHAVDREGWDRPHRPRSDDMIEQWTSWAEKVARRVGSAALDPLAREFEKAALELRARRPVALRRYALCHNRVTPDNVIVRAGGPACLIDLERVKFGSHLQELAKIRNGVLSGDETRFAALLAGYLRAAPKESHPEADPRAWAWHLALADFERAHGALREGRRDDALRILAKKIGG